MSNRVHFDGCCSINFIKPSRYKLRMVKNLCNKGHVVLGEKCLHCILHLTINEEYGNLDFEINIEEPG